MVKDINIDNIKPNIDNQKLLAKLLNGKHYNLALKDYYREKNLDMIDSLTTLSSSKEELDGILYKRNYVMLKSIDSLMQTGSLFAAVGAAHLPGKKGLIELLRKKGYKVKPIISNYTEVSKNQKKKIDQLFKNPKQTNYVSSDKLISSKVLEEVQHQGNSGIISPDLTNGSFMQIQRLPLNKFLLEKGKRINHLTLDSLFYENIKGEILGKTFTENEVYQKYDIKNKTKSGDFQRHQFYITPLEVIGINFAGKLDYVTKFESLVFNSLNLNIPNNGFQQINPKFSNFSIKMPKYSVVYGEESEKSKDDLQVYGYDFNSKSYYFVIEKTLCDFSDFEEKKYELKRIQEELLIEYDALKNKKVIKDEEIQLVSNSKIKDQDVFLKTTINGNKYYLLGLVNGSLTQANDFFDSFKTNQIKLDNDFKRFQERDIPISFELPFEQNKSIFLLKDSDINNFNRFNNKKVNHFKVKNKNYTINSLYHPSVLMNISPFHRYHHEINSDSIVIILKKSLLNSNDDKTVNDVAASVEDLIKEDFDNEVPQTILNAKSMNYYEYYGATNIGEIKSEWNKKLGFDKIENRKLKIEQEKKYFDSTKNCEIFEGILTKDGSDQAVKFRYLISNQSLIELKTFVDKKNTNSEFLNKITQSISYLPKESKFSVYDGKWNVFLDDVNSKQDSIRFSAFNSLDYLKLENENLNSVKDFIQNFAFKKEENKYKNELIVKISELTSKEAYDYLKTTYENSFDVKVQLEILKGLASQKNQKSYQNLNNLLKINLPIPEQEFYLNPLFTIFNENIKYSETLANTLLTAFSIPEYKIHILNYLDALNTNKLLQKKLLKSNLKPLLLNANLELKNVQSFIHNEENTEHSATYNAIQNSLKYIRVLFPLNSENEIAKFFDQSLKLNVKEISLQYAILEKYHTSNINSQLKTKLLSNPKTLISTYLLLNDYNTNSYKYSEKELRESAIVIIDDIDFENQIMEYLFSKEKEVNNQKIIFYFYKLSPKEKDETLKQIDGSKNILLSVGFVLDEKNKPLINTFYSGLQKEIQYEEDLEELSETVIDEALNKARPKSTSGKTTNKVNQAMDFYPY